MTDIAEKISALKTETYFRDRQAQAELAAFDIWLNASLDVKPTIGDELP
ncbi:conserved hypothetical protein [Crenothrix polyspora]|uniref:Uncharacterized protein n=1 Tax=Crenothrix polyspora TaxID=360316 RepID=A0A1R4HEH0_9GAMM|nr:hypothetical protein [Crenothrix polyspora]SJM94290.1 conserved hypothetical protein [Crenothrix polyspora]